ncbi:MAG: VanZ family protein [Spirochaetales bacterium]|nr:VanZ family protein [Spirochaetales bacterium]
MKKTLLLFPYCLLILITIVLADLGKLPLHLLSGIPHYDKAAHLVVYGLLYGLLNSFLKKRAVSILNRNFSFAFMITAVLITAEEFSQLLFPSRTFSLVDLLMGFIGVFIVNISLISIFPGEETP